MNTINYMPHGHCYLWEPALVATHVISDGLIGLAYVTISITLYVLIRKIKMPFSPIFLAFGTFIAACGMTHFMEVWNLWHADYWFASSIKMVTALASVTTGAALIRLVPKVVEFAQSARLSEERGRKLEGAYSEMEKRVRERTRELEIVNEREREARRQVEVLYASAQRVNVLKEEFLATVSHELRTPIGVIQGYIEMIQMELEKPNIDKESIRQSLAIAHRNAKTQTQLVGDLLDVSMIISGKMQLQSKIFDVREVVEAAIGSVSLGAKAKDIHIMRELPADPLPVSGDFVRLQQIIWNLLSNAIKFTEPGGDLRVCVLNENSKCVIEVKDSGMGIDPAFLPYVFDRFTQEDASLTRRYGGLGLGLGIVRHLTELHGGSVHADSRGKGMGSTFKVCLPIAPLLPHADAEKTDGAYPHLQGLRVLIVDDEPDMRSLVASHLKKSGIHIDEASNAEEGLNRLNVFRPHVLVCDLGMPEKDGFNLIRILRDNELREGGFTPAVALTAYVQSHVRQRALSSGFQSYLAKPTDPSLLIKEIVRLAADF